MLICLSLSPSFIGGRILPSSSSISSLPSVYNAINPGNLITVPDDLSSIFSVDSELLTVSCELLFSSGSLKPTINVV